MTHRRKALARMLALLGWLLVATMPARANPQTPARVRLVRLDCGRIEERDFSFYSDTHSLDGRSRTLVDSCYLIQHGDEFMLWETGLPVRYVGKDVTQDTTVTTLAKTLLSQLVQIGVEPRQVRYVGISHYHDDHTGQALEFSGATLLIGSQDWETLRAAKPGRFDSAGLGPWVTGGAPVEAVRGDRDIFGDGSVFMLSTPGHTAGHHSLLVRLRSGAILLTGDAAHSAANYASNSVPSFNVNRADTLASLDRLKSIARNLRATVIVEHEASDIGKLSSFPRWTE